MWRSAAIDRRGFVQAAGIGFLAALKPEALLALTRADAVYASGIRAANGSFAVATVTERGEIVDQVALPARAHDPDSTSRQRSHRRFRQPGDPAHRTSRA